MTRARLLRLVASAAIAAAAAAYLHDPPWIGETTSGLRKWEEDPPGVRFRWTAGYAAFFVPSGATMMTLPLRAQFPGLSGTPVTVQVSVDDRWLTEIVLADPNAWVRTLVPLPRRPTSRRHQRVDLRVNRTVGESNLGVQLGETVVEGSAQAR